VLEVRDGSPVTEVAGRYGVSRQTIYAWRDRFERDGIAGLQEASRRPHTSPRRLAADLEALVCELRGKHRRWGARRIRFELGRLGVQPVPGRATVHRALSRNGLVAPQEQQHKRKYRRWQREAPMALWQVDIVGGIFLAGGREAKLVTGIDDHSRFVVIAALQILKGQGLRWLGLEGKPGLAEEPGDEAVLSLDAVQRVAHRGGELAGGAGGEVAEAVLHYRPGALNGVEVGGVRRQPEHCQPVGVAGGEGLHLAAEVGGEVVPDHDDGGVQVAVRGGDQAGVVCLGHGPAGAGAQPVVVHPVEEPARLPCL
jgi:transposase